MKEKVDALIVDDELNGAENLRSILNDFCPEVNVLKIASSLDEAERDIKNLKPSLVFLDIQIGTRMVFEMLETFSQIQFEIIFVSAHNHALDAFKFMAIDYLLKPIDIESLVMAVNRATVNINNQKASVSVQELLNAIKGDDSSFQKIAIPTSDGYEMVLIDEILYCQAEGSYTVLYLNGGASFMVSKNLKYYEDLLKKNNFIRIHHSSLVNCSKIKKVSKSDGGYIVMDDGKDLSISKSRRDETFAKLNL
ncbi:MAG: LytTR family DNA-binding domain-containing protein [Reichenbachiella sp.]|uniref:LytR/AlgR family response regulator transcription factor n=1 Tax=Reichenbachiella sp. TaxID=2184521 RepID=UPI003263533F